VREALRQLDAQGAADFEAHQEERARREAESGRKLPGREPSPTGSKGKERLANTTDPDSRMLRARNRFVQGYNAKAALSSDQVVVAAEVTNAANDATMLIPMVGASEANLAAAGATAPAVFAADTGYRNAENLAMDKTAEPLVPADQHGRADPAALRKEMLTRLGTDTGRSLYAKRKVTTEPVFGNIKANLRHRRFSRRGLSAVQSEWRLICSVHNPMKIQRRRLAIG